MTETTVTVSTSAQLIAALESATGGETILLEGGDYGKLSLYDQAQPFVKFSSEVTIRSDDASNQATFSEMGLTGVENLTIDSVIFDYSASVGAPTNEKPFRVINSSDIVIKNSTFDGDVATGVSEALDGYGTAYGLYVRDSSAVTIDSNEFFSWARASIFEKVDGLIVKGNDVHTVRSDGMDFSGVNDVVIEDNYIHDFVRSPESTDHPDMIQFWASADAGSSSNVVIRSNVLDSGTGGWTQSIFVRGTPDIGPSGIFNNILIENNVIYNAHIHGITVGETLGLAIQNNTILHNEDSGSDWVPAINVIFNSSDVVVQNNIVPQLNLTPSADWSAENNLVVQRVQPNGSNYVGDLFVNALADSSATLSDLVALPGSLIEQLDVGSSLTRFNTTPEDIVGFLIDDSGSGMNLLTHTFDASNLYSSDGKLDVAGSQVTWDFGDGTSVTDLTPSHTYAVAGTYEVTAVVTLGDGTQVQLRKTAEVDTPVALDTNFDSNADDLSDIVTLVDVSPEVTFEQSEEGRAVRLNGGSIKYDAGVEFRNNSEYTLFFDFKKDAGAEESSGTVINFGYSFTVILAADGISVALTTPEGNTWLKAEDIGISDADWHRVALTFSGVEGVAVLYLDGQAVGQIAGLEGVIQGERPSQDLFVGDPWGTGFPGLIDNVAFLRGAITAEQVAAGFSAEDLRASAAPISGTAGNDTIDGSALHDTLSGLDGNDVLNGGGGNDWLDGGAGFDILIGGSGNDTLIFDAADNLVALDGGSGTDTLVINGGMLPSINLAAHSIELADHVVTGTGSEPWSEITNHYGTGWVRFAEDRTYLDGRTWHTDWDVAGTEPWSKQVSIQDVPDTESWSEHSMRFDDLNRLYEQSGTFDDGRTWHTQWDVVGTELWSKQVTYQDVADTYSWSKQIQRFDTLNRLYDQAGTYDDGRTWQTQWDVDNSFSWTEQMKLYDSSNRLYDQAGTFDDGRTWHTQWDVAGTEPWYKQVTYQDVADTQSWSEQTQLFDATNRLYDQAGTFDDGRTWHTQWDVVGTEPWSKQVTYQDVADTYSWSEQTQLFDTLNRLYDQTGTFDNGMTWRALWDVDGFEIWHKQTTIVDVADNFSWAEQIYEYDVSGNLFSHVVVDDAIV